MRSLFFTLCLAAPLAAVAVPLQYTHTGRVADSSGAPVEGTQNVTVSLYTTASGGSAVWTETQAVNFTDGFFSLHLGANGSNPLGPDELDRAELYVGVAVGSGAELSPRVKLQSVPYAALADTATNVDGGVVDASELYVDGSPVLDTSGKLAVNVDWTKLDNVPSSLVDGDQDTLGALSCSNGQVAQWNGSAWACATVQSGGGGGGDIDASAIVSGTVSIDRLPVGTTDGTLASGIHTHDAGDITTGVLADGRIPNLDAAKLTTGTLDAARIPDLSAAKITSGTLDLARLPANNIAQITGCSNGQIPSWNASSSRWTCVTPSGGGSSYPSSPRILMGEQNPGCTAITSGIGALIRFPVPFTANPVVLTGPSNVVTPSATIISDRLVSANVSEARIVCATRAEGMGWLALPTGVHLIDGKKVQAGINTAAVTTTVFYDNSQPFSSAPIVLLSSGGTNAWVKLIQASDPGGFQIRRATANQPVQWVAMEPGTYNVGRYKMIVGRVSNGSTNASVVNFPEAFRGAPTVLLTMHDSNDNRTTAADYVRVVATTPTSFTFQNSNNSYEFINYIAFYESNE